MTDSDVLLKRIARVGAQIDPALSDRDVERLVSGARRRGRRRSARRLAVAAGVAGLVLAALALRPSRGPVGSAGTRVAARVPAAAPSAPSPPAPEPVAAPSAPPVAAPLRLADGSVATARDAASALTVGEVSKRRVTLDLARGGGRFEVPSQSDRRFSVHAGDVTVTGADTVFTIERVADRIGVNVERGRATVDWGAGTQRLAAGQSGWFPPLQVGVRAQPVAARPRLLAGSRARTAAEPVRMAATPPAFEAPAPLSPPAAVPAERTEDTAEALLAAADVARVAGRPRDGAALLRRVLLEHRSDPRAPLAAFTLGRLLLMELGQPRQAAAAFAEAQSLAPQGPFAEDALAREVEALAKAGERAEAQARARDYQRLYPKGRRAPAVRAFGGGE